ncbi:ankyrin repeat domain-containing protein [Candidatus Neptunichlamydia sp. REUL1]|uniref:ankyrin repeat domain-containing protein n=1 Tax=Candidatus Neptunichlamydia sp. REUL1 TaxID=3064277 RepID=UPI00292F6902|nr:ankyrin repeat domain-containing protein [Candidatus Neptunochlamydia sp. REUL1]
MLDRTLAENEKISCPQAFPPLPVSLQKELKLPFMPLLESMSKKQLTQVDTYLHTNPASEQMIHDAYDAIHDGMVSYVKKHSSSQKLTVDQYGDLTFEVLQYFKNRYQAFEKNIAALFKGTEFEGAMTNASIRQKFFQHVDHRIVTSHGNQRLEMIKIKDAATKWFANPLAACFEDSGFLFSLLDGSVKFIRECSGSQIRVAGGCGVAVEDMEIDEGEDPEAVAKGYLYPPLANYPFDNHVMNVLQAIVDEDVALFEKSCAEIKDWNFKDPSRVSLVHHASRCKSPAILQKLIQKGADLRVIDLQGFYPTHYAAASNSVECLKVLLSHAPELLEVQAEEGQTPLFAAAQYGAYKSVDVLLSLGASPNCAIVNDLSPLLWAIQSKNSQIAMRLLAHESIHLDHALRDGSCALDYAIEGEQIQIVRRLIERGANVNRKCRGYTPLHLAVVNGYLGGVKILLECRDTVLTAKTSEGEETPMMMAQRLGHQEIVNLLAKQAAYRR